MLEFSRPIWLLGLLALPGIFWLAHKLSYASLGPYQKWFSLAVRITVWVLLVFSLAGAQFIRRSDRVSVVLVRDSSDSISDAGFLAVLSEIEAARQTMRKDDSLGKVSFGANAYLEFLPQPGVSDRLLAEWQTDPRGNFTNIGEAIQLAVASFPANAQKRLVLVTDGNENIGSALAEARVARDNGVELFTVPLQSSAGAEVVLVSIETPSQASLGETVSVRFVLDSNVATPAQVSLIRNGEFVDKVPINVRPGKETYEFPVVIDQSGFFTYELVIEPEYDSIAENNQAYAYSVVSGTPRLLYATGDKAEADFLPVTLRTHEIEVDVVSPGGIPYNLADFQVYDGIIFSDVAAYEITDDQMLMIQVLVRDFGRGFMMIGGEKSFGPGGYFDTPIEEVLPVDMDFRRKKITPSSLVVALIDKSGSMGATVGGVQKIAMAKEACKAVVKLQQHDDWVGVMGFDGVGQWVVEPTKGINKNETLAAISAMQAGGGTDLYPALKSAYEAAMNVPVQIRHFLIFTDGIVAPADFEGLLRKMKNDNCTVSTVAFGSDADIPFMKDLAKAGGGQMYEAKSLHDLPKIFTREVFMANKATLTEEPFRARPTGMHPLVSAIAWGGAPNLYGYVATAAKDNAQVPLITHKDDPLLAVWRYGLGKSAAFTSDAKNRWARDWLGWDGYERFWSGVARWIRSDLDSSGVDVRTSISGNEGVIQVSAVSEGGEFINYSQIEARIIDPGMESSKITLKQTGPGQYEGRFPVTDNGNYFINVIQNVTDDEGNLTPVGAQASGLAVSYSPEYRDLEPNRFVLNQLAQSSLAPEGVSLAGLFTEGRKPTRRLEDAWELFTLIALLLWLFDVAVRRLALDLGEMKAALGLVFAGAGGRRAVSTSQSLAGLLKVKQRVKYSTTTAKPDPGLDLRKQKLSAQAAMREKATGASPGLPTEQAGGKITAPIKQTKPSQTASSLSGLRKKLGKDTSIPARKLGQETFEVDSTAGPTKKSAAKPKPSSELSGRDVTSRLLKKKRRWKDDE